MNYMAGFTEKIHLKGKAEEDIYFAELDRKLIHALHEKNSKTSAADKQQLNALRSSNIRTEKNKD